MPETSSLSSSNDPQEDATTTTATTTETTTTIPMEELCHVIQTELDNMAQALMCPICRQTYKDPVLISQCVHAYCRNCILQALSSSQQQSHHACPVCKQRCTKRSLLDAPSLQQLVQLYKQTTRHFGLAPVRHDPSLAMTQLPYDEEASNLEQLQDDLQVSRVFGKVMMLKNQQKNQSNNNNYSHLRVIAVNEAACNEAQQTRQQQQQQQPTTSQLMAEAQDHAANTSMHEWLLEQEENENNNNNRNEQVKSQEDESQTSFYSAAQYDDQDMMIQQDNVSSQQRQRQVEQQQQQQQQPPKGPDNAGVYEKLHATETTTTSTTARDGGGGVIDDGNGGVIIKTAAAAAATTSDDDAPSPTTMIRETAKLLAEMQQQGQQQQQEATTTFAAAVSVRADPSPPPSSTMVESSLSSRPGMVHATIVDEAAASNQNKILTSAAPTPASREETSVEVSSKSSANKMVDKAFDEPQEATTDAPAPSAPTQTIVEAPNEDRDNKIMSDDTLNNLLLNASSDAPAAASSQTVSDRGQVNDVDNQIMREDSNTLLETTTTATKPVAAFHHLTIEAASQGTVEGKHQFVVNDAAAAAAAALSSTNNSTELQETSFMREVVPVESKQAETVAPKDFDEALNNKLQASLAVAAPTSKKSAESSQEMVDPSDNHQMEDASNTNNTIQATITATTTTTTTGLSNAAESSQETVDPGSKHTTDNALYANDKLHEPTIVGTTLSHAADSSQETIDPDDLTITTAETSLKLPEKQAVSRKPADTVQAPPTSPADVDMAQPSESNTKMSIEDTVPDGKEVPTDTNESLNERQNMTTSVQQTQSASALVQRHETNAAGLVTEEKDLPMEQEEEIEVARNNEEYSDDGSNVERPNEENGNEVNGNATIQTAGEANAQSSDDMEVDNTQPADDKEKELSAISIGSIVQVQSRTWPGMNKLGGVARVTHVHSLAGGLKAYDVKYVLGGREKKVDAVFVSLKNSNFGTANAVGVARGRKSHRLVKEEDYEIPPKLLEQLASEGFDTRGTAWNGARAKKVAPAKTKENSEPSNRRRGKREASFGANDTKPRKRRKLAAKIGAGLSKLVKRGRARKTESEITVPVPELSDAEKCQYADCFYEKHINAALKKSVIQVVASSLPETEMEALQNLCKESKKGNGKLVLLVERASFEGIGRVSHAFVPFLQ